MALLIGSICAFTCTKQHSPSSAYVGTWQTSSAGLKVRTRSGFMKYEFTPLDIPVTLTINAGGKASCTLGAIQLDSLRITANKGDSIKTGIAYIIHAGKTGKLSTADPLTDKKIELWIRPGLYGNKLQVEVRQMELFDAFPMGELQLTKKQ